MDSRDLAAAPRVAYFFTRFPHLTETFIQREVRAMRKLGLEPRLHSLHGGEAAFDGVPIVRFSKWRLLALFWRIPAEGWRKPAETMWFLRRLFFTWPRDWMNHWENLYGAGIATILAPAFRREPVEHMHAVWASLPAMTAWVLSRLTGIPFSMGAHAYDLFDHGGDWFLREKAADAAFVHTSTAAGVRRLRALGIDETKIIFVRRGLDRFPECRPLRPSRATLRIVCVARLVEKKGLSRQLALYDFLRTAGLDFTVQILGGGPLRARLEAEIRARRLGDRVTLAGLVPHERVWAELASADVLIHTGIVTATGDRDGVPNVVPEAMAAGVLVVTAPAEGVQEVIEHERTGFVCALDDPAAWLAALRRIRDDDALADEIRERACAWVKKNFDAQANAAIILSAMRRSVADAALRRPGSSGLPPDFSCCSST